MESFGTAMEIGVGEASSSPGEGFITAVDRWQHFLLKAEQRYSLGDYDGAIRACDQVLRQQPTCREAYFTRGKSFYGKKYFGPAIRDFETVVNSNSFHEEAKIFLEKALILKQTIMEELVKSEIIEGFKVVKYLGSGWEGVVFLVCDEKKNKYVLKRFYDHRVEKLNCKTIEFYREPVAGGVDHLLRLSECLKNNPCDYFYHITPISRDAEIIGLVYKYEKLLKVYSRYLSFPDVNLCLFRAFLETQKYLLSHLSMVMVDASIGQFMISKRGQFRFIDYGESINPINDFRCKEEHWEITTLIYFIYQLFKPSMRKFFNGKNFHIVCDHQRGLVDLAGKYPFIDKIVNRINNSDFDAFVDSRFYEELVQCLPHELSLLSRSKIYVYHCLNHLKEMVGAGLRRYCEIRNASPPLPSEAP